MGFDNLKTITISEGVEKIGVNAFYECNNIGTLTLPSTLDYVSRRTYDGAGYGIIGTINIYVKDDFSSAYVVDCNSSSSKAFLFQNLNIFHLNTVEELCEINFDYSDEYVLEASNRFYLINDENGNIEYNEQKYSLVTDVIIPSSVTTINNFAFCGFNSLTSVVIPNSVTNIGYRAFNNCSNLTIYCDVDSEQEGWSYSWNYHNCPVVWDVTELQKEILNSVKFYSKSFAIMYAVIW